MNQGHLDFCGGPEWRQMIEETILPDALAGVDLGPDVIEIGPGPGFTTDILRTITDRLTAVEVDEALAASLTERLRGTNVEVVLGDATALALPDDRFTGAASFHMLHHIESSEAQDRAFGELARVLRSGGELIAVDGVASEGVRLFHEGDTYNPIDPDTVEARLTTAGFTSISVRMGELGWICRAAKPAS